MRRRSLAAVLVLVVALAAPQASAQRLSEAAGWLREYLRIDTSNPPGAEHRAAAYLGYLLHRERIPTELIVTTEGRANLVARLPATVQATADTAPEEAGALLLTHHMDVVPPGAGWSREPFAGVVADERLWGRGALDAKGLGITQLAAFIALARSDAPRSREVIFLAVADEEKGGGQGMAWLFEHRPELFEGLWAVFNEGGGSRVAAGERLLWWEVEVAQKRPLWLRVVSRGRGGHGSSFNPASAVHHLIGALDRVLELPQPYRVSPAVRAYAAALSPLHRGPNRAIFADIDAHFARPEGDRPPLPPGIYKLFADTVQVTVLEGSQSINVIPTVAAAQIDARLLPDSDADAFLARLREALGPGIEIEVLVSAPPTPPSPADHPAFAAIAEILGESAAVVPSPMAGFTDSRHFRQRGIPAYGLSPFAVGGLDQMGIHGIDEAVRLDVFDAGVERMRRIVERCVRPR